VLSGATVARCRPTGPHRLLTPQSCARHWICAAWIDRQTVGMSAGVQTGEDPGSCAIDGEGETAASLRTFRACHRSCSGWGSDDYQRSIRRDRNRLRGTRKRVLYALRSWRRLAPDVPKHQPRSGGPAARRPDSSAFSPRARTCRRSPRR